MYKLALPEHSKIHNVFHCSLLKAHEGPPPTAVDKLPSHSIYHHPLIAPLDVLQTMVRLIEGAPIRLTLIQLAGMPSDDTL